MKSDIPRLESEIEKAKNSILLTIISASFALIGAMFAIQKFVR